MNGVKKQITVHRSPFTKVGGERKVLKAKDLSKTFEKGHTAVHAVRKVDIEIAAGERIYIHGPSGAGKSTLLHLLGALARPTEGEVAFEGRSIYKMGDRRRSIIRSEVFAFIFQFYHLLPELNVLENVILPARILGKKSGKDMTERAYGILGKVGMGHRLKHRPSELSGGESQRVAIARALVNSPRVLFCDEPTGNLDSAMSREIYDLILKVSEEEKMSVVVVSHQGIIEGFYHSEYLMRDGVLERVIGKQSPVTSFRRLRGE